MANSKTPPCNRGCGQLVWFNWGAKAGEPGRSDFGKLRPLQVSEDGEMLNEIHECPNSDFNKKRTNGGAKVGNVQIEGVLGNTMDIIARLEKQETQISLIASILPQISRKLDTLIGQTHINNNNSESTNSETPQ